MSRFLNEPLLHLADHFTATEGMGWKTHPTAETDVGGDFQPDGGVEDTWTGGIGEANVSKHADDGFADGAPADGGCRT